MAPFIFILNRLKRSAFFKNILVVMTGTALAQIIGFALSPVISRLYSPSDFGVYGSFNAVLGVIAAAVTLEYSQAIMLPKRKEEAANLFALSLLCTFLISLFCLLFSLLLPSVLNSIMRTKGFWTLGLLSLSILILGANLSIQSWAVRSKAFKHTSASQFVRSLSSNGTRIGLGFLSGGAPGLIVSSLLGNIFASLVLIRYGFKNLSFFRQNIHWKTIKRLSFEYRDFPFFTASQGLINALSSGLPVILLSRYFGITIAGSYAFSISVLQVPMGFLLTALKQVLFQKASETNFQGEKLSSLYIRTTAILISIVILPSIIVFIWAPQLFSLIFGHKWAIAGDLSRGLIIWMAVSFCNLPAVLFARIIRIQRFVFFYDIALLAARTIMLLLGCLFLDVFMTVLLFSIIGAVMNAYLIFHVGRTVLRKEGIFTIKEIRNLIKADL